MTNTKIQELIDEEKATRPKKTTPIIDPNPIEIDLANKPYFNAPEVPSDPGSVFDPGPINAKLEELERENALLRADIVEKDKNIQQLSGKNLNERIEQVKKKIDSHLRGFYKISNFDLQELISLL